MGESRSMIFVLLLILGVVLSGCKSEDECKQFTPEDAVWLLDEGSPDFDHLDTSTLTYPFTLTSDSLAELFSLNHFDLNLGQDEVLFGLRGCEIVGEKNSEFSTFIDLREVSPDHINYRDVLGVWKQSAQEFVVFPGSTVPNWDYMCWQAEEGGHTANMLPTGMYSYEVGTHRDIEGAFRQDDEIVVLRSNDDLIYETTDLWEVWTPNDNIHPGGCPESKFSSAGCQTIEGTFGSGCDAYPDAGEEQHVGDWGVFRVSAGLDPENIRDKWGETYFYILLTCREAGLVGEGAVLERLRFGSQGAAVLALQSALRDLGYGSVPLNGKMGPNTTYALIQWEQAQNDGAADGILTPAEAEIFGFSLGK